MALCYCFISVLKVLTEEYQTKEDRYEFILFVHFTLVYCFFFHIRLVTMASLASNFISPY